MIEGKEFLLSDKYLAYMMSDAECEFLEGTTKAGKTTTAIPKFMFKVAQSDMKQHIIAGLDAGTIEKNIINADLGLLDIFGSTVEYNGSGTSKEKLPHIVYHIDSNKAHDKIIYVLGYNDVARWKKALGGQCGGLYIDEFNIANIDFVREAWMRAKFKIVTLNPDDPELEIYKEFVNHSRPLEEWSNNTPDEILKMLNEEPKPGWVHWFFSFEDNLGLTPEDIERTIRDVPVGTKLYKNKILGLRGRATGLVFNVTDKTIITVKEALSYEYELFTAGVDTSYSRKSDDTITFIFEGITTNRKKIILAEEVYNNTLLVKKHKDPLAPSDIPPLLVAFLERNRHFWVKDGDAFAPDIFIDSADQATITELEKYNREVGSLYNFVPAWKKMKILDRINLEIGWLAQEDSLIVDTCKECIRERNTYSWKEDKKEPEDANDHTVNGDQYAWLPHKHLIGKVKE